MIQAVVESKLCTQCGFCAALCPATAISMRRDSWENLFPAVDQEKCTRCGFCVRICSGHHFPFDRQGGSSSSTASGSALCGPYRSCWSGYARDRHIRNISSSGGAVSALLSGLLHSGRVGKALVVHPSNGGAYRAESSFVSDVEGCLSASRSWYLPVSMENAVREVQREEVTYAVVGLPCHIQAWRKAAGILPDINRKIAAHIGLFCSHVVDVRFWRLLLRLFGIPPDKVGKISFRDQGWPGSIRVELLNGEEKTIPYDHALRKMLWKIYVYTPRRCLMCYDLTAEFADVSAGDAWLPEFAHDRDGMNTVIVRSRIGEEVCREAVDSGKLRLEPMEVEKLERSQRFDYIMKKRDIGARFKVVGKIGLRTPGIGTDLPKPAPEGYLLGSTALAVSHMSSKGWFEFAARLIPWRTLGVLYSRNIERFGQRS